MDRVLKPQWLERCYRLGDLDRRRQVPHLVHLDGDLHLVTHCLVDQPERLRAFLNVLGRDVLTVGLGDELVKWPDLHCPETFRMQALRESHWIGQECVLVLIGTVRAVVDIAGFVNSIAIHAV